MAQPAPKRVPYPYNIRPEDWKRGSLFKNLFVCFLCACMYMQYMSVWAWACTYIYKYDQKPTSGLFLYFSPPYCFQTGPLTEPELIISAGVVASEPTRPLLPHFQLPGQVLQTWAAFCMSARSLNSGPHSCTASTLPTESAQPLPLLLTLVLILLKVLSLWLKCKFLSDSCKATSVVEY